MRGYRQLARRRTALAVVMALLWLLGVEVLPNAHLATHDTDHTHGAGAIQPRVRVTFEAHAHADGSVHAHADEAAAARTPNPPRRDQLAFDVPLDGHAAAGLAHRAVALHAPPPPPTAALELPRRTWWIQAPPTARLRSTHGTAAIARGPPSISVPAYSIESRHLRRAA